MDPLLVEIIPDAFPSDISQSEAKENAAYVGDLIDVS